MKTNPSVEEQLELLRSDLDSRPSIASRVEEVIPHRSPKVSRCPSKSQQQRTWAARVAALGAAMVAMGLLAPWSYFQIEGGPIVFADTIAEMKSARSVRFDTFVSAPGVPERMMFTTTIVSPNLRRAETPNGIVAISDLQQGKSLVLDTKQKKAKLETSLGYSGDFYNETLHADPEKGKQLPPKEFGGRRCVGFEFRTKVAVRESKRTVWIDEQTKLPVRIVIVHTYADSSGQEVLTNFVFDGPIEESLFSLVPPDGYDLRPAQRRNPAVTGVLQTSD